MKKMMITMTALAAALVLLFPAAASADVGRTVVDGFEFFSVGHGDTGGFCLNDPEAPVPPEGAAFQSCTEAVPAVGEDHVGITVVDSAGQPVYFTVQQDNNPGFAGGCGTLQWGTLSTDGLFPINDQGPGGTEAPPVVVFPWAGPGINNVLDPGGAACTGSLDTNIITPGEEGSTTFVLHNHAA